jgi:hypothetical protein
MAAGISETGGLDYVFAQLLGKPTTSRGMPLLFSSSKPKSQDVYQLPILQLIRMLVQK